MSSAEQSGAPASSVPFSFGTRMGLIFIAQTACASLIAVLGLLSYIAFSTLTIREGAKRRWDVSTPFHWYFLSMLTGEIIQALGAAMNIKWAIDAGVTEGSFCITQGLFINMGNIIASLSTLAIDIHTFRAIVFHWHPDNPHRIATIISAFIWLTAILITLISAATHESNLDQYWGKTQFWCMITTRYRIAQIMLQYIFMWVTAFVSIVLYIPLALVIGGIITVDGYSLKIARKNDGVNVRSARALGSTGTGRTIDSKAMQMLFYPLLYVMTVLPIAIARFRAFYNKPVPVAATIIADIIFCSSGIINVFLYSRTRPLLMPHRRSQAMHNPILISVRSQTITDQEISMPRIGASDESSYSNLDGDWSAKGTTDP